MDEAAISEGRTEGGKRRWLKYVKWTLLAAVLMFVLKRAGELWDQDHLHAVRVDAVWLLPAMLCYLGGWIPSTWFFRRVIHAMGGHVRFRDAARAYYCGHLGKYIPGKAMVLVIRAGLLSGRGSTATAAVVAGTYETLASMGTGLAIGVALGPKIFSNEQWAWVPTALQPLRNHPTATAVVTAVLVMAVLPFVSRISSWLVGRLAPKASQANGDNLTATPVRIPLSLLYTGTAAFVLAWAMHGLSLGFTLRAISPDAFRWQDWPMWTATVASATSIGFFAVFAPGGIGVREGILIEALRIQPNVGPQVAVVAAVLLRMVWFAAEILAAALLYWGFGKRETTA